MQLETSKKYNVVLTGEEIGLIQNALVELPFSVNLMFLLPVNPEFVTIFKSLESLE